MDKSALGEILEKHGKWLNDEDGGEGADLQGADLQGADLREADLWRANLQGANLREANLQGADLQGANLRQANLREADLQGANLWRADLRKADLQGADLDFSCWPLWCGSFDVKADDRIAAQLAYHFCRLDVDSDEYEAARKAIAEYANKFHRVEECGRIEVEEAHHE